MKFVERRPLADPDAAARKHRQRCGAVCLIHDLCTARTHLQRFRSGTLKCKHNPQAALSGIATPGLKGRFSANRFLIPEAVRFTAGGLLLVAESRRNQPQIRTRRTRQPWPSQKRCATHSQAGGERNAVP